MKEIIAGKVYNTDTAQKIFEKVIKANVESNLPTAFDILYQKRTQETKSAEVTPAKKARKL